MASPDPKIPKIVTIDPEGDLTINFYEPIKDGPEYVGGSGKRIFGRVLAIFKVSRQVVSRNSRQFGMMLMGVFQEAGQHVIDIEEGTVNSLELWFRVLHDAMTDEMYCIPIEDVWEAIEVCGYRNFDIKRLNTWFEKWFSSTDLEELEIEDMCTLLYPCHEFNHAKGFAFLTKSLAYQMAGHITEINPTSHRHLHLEGNVIGSINGARGSLRSKMLRGLFEPVDEYLKQRCSCKAEALFSYCTGLSKTGIWPLESHHKKSVQTILDGPNFIKFVCKPPPNACVNCLERLASSTLTKTRLNVLRDFDGLCLDCMDRTKPKLGGVDEDYWEHDRRRAWSSDCRITHDQPTWYFSFMGRKTEMRAHQRKKR